MKNGKQHCDKCWHKCNSPNLHKLQGWHQQTRKQNVSYSSSDDNTKNRLNTFNEMQTDVYTRSEEILSDKQREALSRQQKMEAGMLRATMRAFAQ